MLNINLMVPKPEMSVVPSSVSNGMATPGSHDSIDLPNGAIHESAEVEDLGGDVVCLLHVVTAGHADHLLGTDEENIIQAGYCVFHTIQQKVRRGGGMSIVVVFKELKKKLKHVVNI